MDNLDKTKIKLEGIIFDFGFTLFHFVNPSLERYMDIQYQGLNLVAEFLKNNGLFENNFQAEKFLENVKKQNLIHLQLSFKTKLEYPTSYIIGLVLKDMKELNSLKLKKFLAPENLESLSDLYHSVSENEWIPFVDTEKTLRALSETNIKTAVLSNTRNHNTIINILKKHDIIDYFNSIVTSAAFGKRKPDIKIFHHTLEKLDLSHSPESCIMVGDEVADMIGGKKAKLKTIMINRDFKFPFEQELLPKYQPDFKINNISELLNYINL